MNRYPGARCDSESYFYIFSDRLSEDLLQDWTWTSFAAQPRSWVLRTPRRPFNLLPTSGFQNPVTAATRRATNRLAISMNGEWLHEVPHPGRRCLSSVNTPAFGYLQLPGRALPHRALAPCGVDFRASAPLSHRFTAYRHPRRSPSRRPTCSAAAHPELRHRGRNCL